jgi:NADPH2:quinone reductase
MSPVGGHLAEPAFRSLLIAWRGRFLVIGFAPGDIPSIPLNLALLKGACIVGAVLGGVFVAKEPAAFQADMAQLLAWVRRG